MNVCNEKLEDEFYRLLGDDSLAFIEDHGSIYELIE
jgi:hypothetical protein